jgi:hypothetical protein
MRIVTFITQYVGNHFLWFPLSSQVSFPSGFLPN